MHISVNEYLEAEVLLLYASICTTPIRQLNRCNSLVSCI